MKAKDKITPAGNFPCRRLNQEQNTGKKAIDRVSVLAAILLIGYCLSLIPILYAGFFAHPIADDFNFSYRVHQALLSGNSLLEAVFETVSNTYNNWQGTFSAIVIFSLQPGVFSSSCYYLTTLIMIGFLTGSTFFLFDTIIRKMLRGRASYVVIISCLTLALSIQFVPSINQAFYWFNGSAFYTLFYSLGLIFFSLLLRLKMAETNEQRRIYCLLSLVLGFVIGGGNYSTALLVAEILILFTGNEFYRNTHNKWLFLIILSSYAVSFIINMIAPGNAVRAKTVTSLNPLMAIAQSLLYSLGKVCVWTQVPQMIYLLAVLLLSVFLVPKCPVKFCRPVFALGLAFLLFASQMTPPLYAMSNIGSGRQINIYYYSYYLLIAFSAFYLCGWVYQRLHERDVQEPSSKTLGAGSLIHQYLWAISIALCVVMGANCYEIGLLNLTSLQTTKAIVDGSLVQYDLEYRAITEMLESGSDQIETKDIETVPPFFSNLDLSEDSEYWTNKTIAEYYGIESIKKAT